MNIAAGLENSLLHYWSIYAMTHNPPLNLTAHQLRWWVPSALRAPAAG